MAPNAATFATEIRAGGSEYVWVGVGTRAARGPRGARRGFGVGLHPACCLKDCLSMAAIATFTSEFNKMVVAVAEGVYVFSLYPHGT